MKGKYVILASTLLMAITTFAQKNEIKAAEKALKKGETQEAVTILKSVESLIPAATDAEKAQFLFVKGSALLELAKQNVETDKNLALAATAYQDLIASENASGKSKYSAQASASIIEIKYKLINSAIADSKAEKHSEGAKKLYDAYLLDKKDTLNLYYAASTYVNAKEYDEALKLYDELKTINYSGAATNYLAVNKLSGEEDLFNTIQERDRMVKMGTHETPRNEDVPSKKPEILKTITLILVQQGNTEAAKKAISEARVLNPDDTSLILTEANLYLETKDYVTYKKLITEVLEKKPNDADLIFNLGVISANAKNTQEAEKYYARAIEIDPKYMNAYINLAALKLENERPIIEEMNKLGNSANDMKRYTELKTKRQNIFRSTIPFLEKAIEIDPKNDDVAKTLLNVYNALEMTAESKALKAKMEE